jgi:hypothetical protein
VNESTTSTPIDSGKQCRAVASQGTRNVKRWSLASFLVCSGRCTRSIQLIQAPHGGNLGWSNALEFRALSVLSHSRENTRVLDAAIRQHLLVAYLAFTKGGRNAKPRESGLSWECGSGMDLHEILRGPKRRAKFEELPRHEV